MSHARTFAAGFACVAFLLPITVQASIHALDLRPKAIARPLLRTAVVTNGILQSTSLSAGATDTTPLAVGDELTFLLFDGVEITVRVTERTESPLGGESFLGEVSGYDGVKNAVVLQTEEGLTVDIQDFANSRVYTIVSTAGGVTVNEIDPSLNAVTPTTPVSPELPSKNRALLSSPALGSTPDQASTLVDVLVAYDTPAATWARQNGGGITNFATMAVQKMNTVLENCGLSSSFRYRLVGVMAVAAEGGTDLNGVLDATRSGTGAWASIKAKRDEVGADIVSTFIDTGSASGTTGLGYSLDSTPISSFSEWPYNVCAVRAVSSSHTMTHEVGHNIGAGHASAVDPNQISPGPQLYDYSAGYYFTGSDGKKYHTIMAYYYDGFGTNYTAVPYFSSPNISYMGTPVGDATHDNVRTIQNTYLAASKWRDQVIPMSYDVYFSPGDGATFTDSITITLTPGKAGLPIRYTLDGSTPTVSSTLYTAPITLTQTTTIRAVTVTDGVAGPVFEATYSISDLGAGVDAPQLSWRASDSVPWAFQTTNTYDGVDAVQVQDNGEYSYESWLETVVTGPTQMSFRYKMRTGEGSFSVKIDGTTQFDDTRSSVSSDDWHLAEVQVPAGSHTVRFVFANKNSRYNGYNGAWLDTVQFDVLSRPPTISPATTDSESTATTFQGTLDVTITPPDGRQGVIYYTVDGSDPTDESALVYSGPVTLTKTTLVRAVFVEDGKDPSSEVAGLYIRYSDVTAWANGVLGTSGITWCQTGTVDWRQVGSERKLRAGGLHGGVPYTSTIMATVTGKGKFVFTYEFNTWTWQNTFVFKVGNTQEFNYSYNGSTSFSGTVTNEVTSTGTATFTWTYTVADVSRDYGQGYSSQAGAWLSNVQWIPEVQAVEVEGVSVPYTWLDGTYPGQGGSAAAYEALALSDTDGDGFLTWQEYLLDTDPKDADSRLFATVRMVDGSPVFGWSHTNANINAQGFRYVPKGRTSLDDTAGWQPYSSGHRFFKVTVEPIE